MANPIDQLRPSYDVVIVGARCAGAATAMLLARAGLDVLVVEQGAYGADTPSTLALMRTGVLQLSRWGLLDAIKAVGTPRIETTTFHYGDERVEIRIKSRDGVDGLYAPRRTLLDPLLADTARASGADVAYRVRLNDLRRDANGRVTGVVVESGGLARSIAAATVIGADGVNSTVAKRVGAEPYLVGAHAGGVIYTLASHLEMDGYHWHWAQGGSAGVIPTNGGETLVFAAAPRQRFMQTLRFDLAAGFHGILRDTAPSVADAMSSAAVGSVPGIRRSPGLSAAGLGTRLGARRRRGVLQGSDHGAWHQRRAEGRRAVGASGTERHRRGAGGLPGSPRRPVDAAVHDHGRNRVVRLGHAAPAGAAQVPQRRNDEGSVACH